MAHLRDYMHEHVHRPNILKVKWLVLGLAGVKMLVAQSAAWIWLWAQVAVVKKVAVGAAMGLLALVQWMLWLTPTGPASADLAAEFAAAPDVCQPYYAEFDFTQDGRLDRDDLVYMQEIILEHGSDALATCRLRYPLHSCDPNGDGRLSASDIAYIEEIIAGVRDYGDVCDGRDNNCDGIVDNPEVLRDAPLARNQYGICAGSVQVCVDGRYQEPDITTLPWYAIEDTQEVCTDGIDNSCSGIVDCEWVGEPGCRCNAWLHGRVWIDTNGDGIQDDEETNYLWEVTITLIDIETQEETVVTTTDGTFAYNWLEAGTTYRVVFAWNDPMMRLSPQYQGLDDQLGSNIPSVGEVVMTYNGGKVTLNMWLVPVDGPLSAMCGSLLAVDGSALESFRDAMCERGSPARVAGQLRDGGELTRICRSDLGGADSWTCRADVIMPTSGDSADSLLDVTDEADVWDDLRDSSWDPDVELLRGMDR